MSKTRLLIKTCLRNAKKAGEKKNWVGGNLVTAEAEINEMENELQETLLATDFTKADPPPSRAS